MNRARIGPATGGGRPARSGGGGAGGPSVGGTSLALYRAR